MSMGFWLQCAVNLQAMSMSTGFLLQVCGKLTGNEQAYGGGGDVGGR